MQKGPASMSHISGVKRPLTHTNSFTGERVPLHGVETPHEEELGEVRKLSCFAIMHYPDEPGNSRTRRVLIESTLVQNQIHSFRINLQED